MTIRELGRLMQRASAYQRINPGRQGLRSNRQQHLTDKQYKCLLNDWTRLLLTSGRWNVRSLRQLRAPSGIEGLRAQSHPG
jgi:hypothetical protein